MDSLAFINRFKELLEDNNFSASAFADEINVQRSNISHILSGRNKPSLDFILKIISRFPDINIYWLLNGTGEKLHPSKGNTPSSPQNNIGSDVQGSTTSVIENKTKASVQRKIEYDIQSNTPSAHKNNSATPTLEIPNTEAISADGSTTVESIVIFYSDGTFKDFKPK